MASPLSRRRDHRRCPRSVVALHCHMHRGCHIHATGAIPLSRISDIAPCMSTNSANKAARYASHRAPRRTPALSSCGFICCMRLLLIQIGAQLAHPGAGEHAEDVALVVVKLLWCLPAEGEQFIEQEGLHAGEGEMCELGTVVEKDVDALDTRISLWYLSERGREDLRRESRA